MKKLPTISIKGKEYVLVKDRIIAFNELFSKGNILTEIIKNDENSVVCKATVYPDVSDIKRAFTGHSEAYRGQGQMGQVPVEVAETSAVGRALAMLGIGVVDSVASADEMKKADLLINNARNGVPSSIVDYQEVMENAPQYLSKINDAKKEFNRNQYTGLASSKQKDLIMSLCLQKGVKTTMQELDKMSTSEASKKIRSLQELPDKVKTKSQANAELDFEEELDDDGGPIINPSDIPF